MSHILFEKETSILKQTKCPSPKCQRSLSITTEVHSRSINEYKQRSMTFTNGIDQVIGFFQRKFSRINDDEEKQEFDDLRKIK
ncbi:unnamed protein product [Adineta steineri]|uniref:Uncharacterized protein n=1 Tax=Adineta steineri TaxID=433720 RepID=A0A819GH16_9BILA|nr:unnamed protein product [Adineta steineri]CAF1059704.1 unnamed protein product [Adineta steineri]CAF1141615.1 unnamed protein product [Adineta steineri]CAF3660292.1 unnamed protein product [Adineta steineri]CAF3886148.1 unnamed protein product [Adineta steineri]